MGKQRYTVTLDEELVERAKIHSDAKEDLKVSPILNHLLREWIEKKEREQEILKKSEKEEKK